MRTVLFRPSEHLVHYLTGVRRFPDGSIKSGLVVNGGYRLEIRGSEILAKEGNFIVSRSPLKGDEYEVLVQDHVKGDYEAVIAWAADERSKTLPGL